MWLTGSHTRKGNLKVLLLHFLSSSFSSIDLSSPLALSTTRVSRHSPNKHTKYSLVPSQPCLFQTNFLFPPPRPLPPGATLLFPLGSQETISSFLNITGRGKSIYDMPVLIFYRHHLSARALEEGIVISMRVREFKQFSQVHIASKRRTEIYTWVFLTARFPLFH